MPQSDKHRIRRVDGTELAQYADRYGLSLTESEREDYVPLVNGTLESFDTVLDAPAPETPRREVAYPERPSSRPPGPDDELNAWIRRCHVTGAPDGPLAQYSVGLKDSIALAGYPMTLGSEVADGYIPSIDATVVHRLLDAGATIVGKQNMESFAFSGSGDTSDFGPVLNPYSDEHLAGGSSSGSAAAVATGDCDVSIGTDQAGSVRIPSACCGTVGLKPTTGLVPYTGAFSLDPGIDHLGPIADSVAPVAATLEAIAGEDIVDGVRMDPRQPRGTTAEEYTGMLDAGVDGLTIGILVDGFDWPFSDPNIDDAVREAIEVFAAEGADTQSVSMDRHRTLSSAGGVIATIGGALSIERAGVSPTSHGWYWSEFADALDGMIEARADRYPPSVKQALLTAAHIFDTRGMTPYAVAKNLALDGERGYDRLLDTCDLLALPTLAVPPMNYDPDLDRVEATSREWMLAANTAAMDLTGHPAISVPCAKVDGLPVGMMLVGAHFDEATLIRAAATFQQAVDWTTR